MKQTLIIFLMSMLLVSCSSRALPIGTDLPKIIPTTTPTNTASPTPLPTSTSTITPKPSPTSTQTPSPTVTPTDTAVKITPVPFVSLSDVSIPGRIYGWVSPFYGYLEPNQPIPEVLNTFPISKEANPGMAASWAFAFSSYTSQIAYIRTTPEQSISLWISDLQLKAPTQVWVDTTGQSGYSGADDTIFLRWGIRDQFVFLENYPAKVQNSTKEIFWLVYSIRTQSMIELSGNCNKLILSPQTTMYALACPIGDRFVVLEQDGTYWETKTLPERFYDVQNYAFSPDGEKVLYVDPANSIYLLTTNDSLTQIPVRYSENVWFKDTPLQWSLDNKRILILGYDAVGEEPHCVWDTFTERVQSCWHLFDATTGERLWWLQQSGSSIASLSPDGRWVVVDYVNYGEFPIVRELIAYDTTKPNAGKIVWFWVVDAIHWGQ